MYVEIWNKNNASIMKQDPNAWKVEKNAITVCVLSWIGFFLTLYVLRPELCEWLLQNWLSGG